MLLPLPPMSLAPLADSKTLRNNPHNYYVMIMYKLHTSEYLETISSEIGSVVGSGCSNAARIFRTQKSRVFEHLYFCDAYNKSNHSIFSSLRFDIA